MAKPKILTMKVRLRGFRRAQKAAKKVARAFERLAKAADKAPTCKKQRWVKCL